MEVDEKQKVSPLVAALTEAKTTGKLVFTLPVSEKRIEMVRSTGRHQLIAQKLYDTAKQGYMFTMECIRQTVTILPPKDAPATMSIVARQFEMDELTALSNEDLDLLHEVYSRFNRAGRYSVTEKDLDAFFVNR